MLLLLQRLAWAFATWPTAGGWAYTLLLTALVAIPAVPLALWADMFSLEHAQISPSVLAKIFFLPALAEEVLWRALSNPHPRELASPDTILFWGILSTLGYVVGHPFNAWMFRPSAKTVFCHPGFLSICTILGAACAAMYQRTGSVWPPVIAHWLTVAVWLSLGGRQRAPFI